MKRLPASGYTIVEVMMFLLVSSAIMGSSMALVSGQQERTRFTNSVTSFELSLKDITNDVATGYFPSAADFRCQSSGGQITFPAGTPPEQGANPGCIYLGKAIELNPNTTTYNVYTMIGAREASAALRDPRNLTEANTELLGANKRHAPNVGLLNPGIIDRKTTEADMVIVRVVSIANPAHNVRGVAIISDFSQISSTGNKVSGNATRGTLYEVNAPFLSNAGSGNPSAMSIASRGVALCLQQGGANGRRAMITIGASGQLSTETQIMPDNATNWPAPCN